MSQFKIKMMFMLFVLDFISDWYSIHRVSKSQSSLHHTFSNMNKLRGTIRDILEGRTDEHN